MIYDDELLLLPKNLFGAGFLQIQDGTPRWTPNLKRLNKIDSLIGSRLIHSSKFNMAYSTHDICTALNRLHKQDVPFRVGEIAAVLLIQGVRLMQLTSCSSNAYLAVTSDSISEIVLAGEDKILQNSHAVLEQHTPQNRIVSL